MPNSRPPVTYELLHSLPKTDLHCHLDGSLRIRTILELGDELGVPLPAKDEAGLRRALHVGENCESLEKYLEAFEITLSVMQSERALYRTAYELAADAAAENVRYMEVRYSPVLHTKGGLPLPAIVEAVTAGLKDAERDHGIRSGVIVCGIRNMSPTISFRMAELAVAFKHAGVVAFDLAGAEVNHPAIHHVEAFRLILNNNVNCTLHAGEAYGPESIHQAIHYCGAHRVGHGCRLAEDGDLLNYVNDHRIALEVCPSSNVQTGAVEELATHPVRFYFDYGLRITMNTDNRLLTDTTVTKELWLAHQHMGFTLDELVDIVVYGFKSAFLPLRDKQRLLLDVTQTIQNMTTVVPNLESMIGERGTKTDTEAVRPR
ncbi:MAG: adenosine deaminase [Deltaproteobacteria bacterium]|nr:adenosine deaminase [Deltaproteobacteria bacterium]